LTFRHNFNVENTFDGGVLEISINGGTFTDIVTAAQLRHWRLQRHDQRQLPQPDCGPSGVDRPLQRLRQCDGESASGSSGSEHQAALPPGFDCSLGVTAGTLTPSKVSSGFTCSTGNCAVAACVITCPANITKSNDPNQCGAVRHLPGATTTGTCGTVTCTPPSGSFFPVGTTTVSCQAAIGGGGSLPSGGNCRRSPNRRARPSRRSTPVSSTATTWSATLITCYRRPS